MKLVLASDQAKWIESSLQLIPLTRTERGRVAFKRFSLFFLLAMGSIFIPVLHFVLVPVFLLLAFVFSWKAYATRYRLRFQAPCSCIQCGRPMKTEFLLDAEARLKCENCFAWYFLDTAKS